MHENINRIDQSFESLFRYYVTLQASAIAGVVLLLTKNVATSDITLVLSTLTTFIFTITLVSWWFLLGSMVGRARKYRAINKIRGYFKNWDSAGAGYISDRTDGPEETTPFEMSYAYPRFICVFVVLYFFGSTLSWFSLLGVPVKDSITVVALLTAFCIIFLIYMEVRVRRKTHARFWE